MLVEHDLIFSLCYLKKKNRLFYRKYIDVNLSNLMEIISQILNTYISTNYVFLLWYKCRTTNILDVAI